MHVLVKHICFIVLLSAPADLLLLGHTYICHVTLTEERHQ
jgi:hypothetical protein